MWLFCFFATCLCSSLCRFWMPWPEFGFRVHGGVLLGQLNNFTYHSMPWLVPFAKLYVPAWVLGCSRQLWLLGRGGRVRTRNAQTNEVLAEEAARAAHAPHPARFHALQWWGTFPAPPRGQGLHHQRPVAVRFDSSPSPNPTGHADLFFSFLFWGTGRLAVVHLLPTASTPPPLI